jgi:hypothetical protein
MQLSVEGLPAGTVFKTLHTKRRGVVLGLQIGFEAEDNGVFVLFNDGETKHLHPAVTVEVELG